MIDKYPRIANDDSQLTQFKNDVIAGEYGGSSVELAGNSLVIAEQPAPESEPVITIDGVDYYHKYEFDLTAFGPADMFKKFNLLTGNQIIGEFNSACFDISSYGPNYPSGSLVAYLKNGKNVAYSSIVSVIAKGSSVVATADYTSRAFTVVDTDYEVIDDSKINLPTCSAYYGFLSDDGKTFISYYNLKPGADVPEYVDSIKQGNAVIPLKDDRLPTAEQADAGKVLKVADAGGYELADAGDNVPVFSFENHAILSDLYTAIGFNPSDSSTNVENLLCKIQYYNYMNQQTITSSGYLSARNVGVVLFSFSEDFNGSSKNAYSLTNPTGNETLSDIFRSATNQLVLVESRGDAGVITKQHGNIGCITLPQDASSKVYGFQSDHGTMKWTELPTEAELPVYDFGESTSAKLSDLYNLVGMCSAHACKIKYFSSSGSVQTVTGTLSIYSVPAAVGITFRYEDGTTPNSLYYECNEQQAVSDLSNILLRDFMNAKNNMSQIWVRVPKCKNMSGTYVLKTISGAMQWVSE